MHTAGSTGWGRSAALLPGYWKAVQYEIATPNPSSADPEFLRLPKPPAFPQETMTDVESKHTNTKDSLSRGAFWKVISLEEKNNNPLGLFTCKCNGVANYFH